MGSSLTKIVIGRDRTAPTTPRNLTATAVSTSQINLTCGPASDPFVEGQATSLVTEYRWWVSASGSNYSLLTTTAAPSYSHTGLEPDSTFYYAVSAVDRTGNESDISEAVSATTLPITATNRPPVWNTDSIRIYVYAGQSVSQSLAGYASDPDGDSVEFGQLPTEVLSQIGLSLSSTGVLSGTIPADAGPQTLVAQIGATDGEFTVALKDGLIIEVADASAAEADWLVRSRADGVFWACNFAEWVRGIDGYTSQPVKGWPSGQPGRISTPIASLAEIPHNQDSTLPSKNIVGDIGDGYGCMRLDAVPNVSGKMLMIRMSPAVEGTYTESNVGDWNILPWAWAPTDFRDADQGTGQPNVRLGIPGTCGEGVTLKFVETESSNPPLVSSQNPLRLPMVRHWYCQFIVRSPVYHWGYMHRLYYFPPYFNGIQKQDRDNKIVFLNGGSAPSEFALKIDHTYAVAAIGYRGSRTAASNGALKVNVRGNTANGLPREQIVLNHTALKPPGGIPPLTGANTAEEWMLARGPAPEGMVWGEGLFPNGTTEPGFSREFDWYHPEDPRLAEIGLSYMEANRISNPARGYPYGGFPLDGRPPFPDLAWPEGFTAGMLRPDVPHVIQVMISDQLNEPVDKDEVLFRDQDASGQKGPRITAVWASPLGDPPTLLFHTGSNGENGPSMTPSRAFHRASGADGQTIAADTATQFKYQENAIAEDKSNCGFMVVGALDGFADPVHDGETTVFYALRANPSGDLLTQYVQIKGNKAVDPGTVHNFGGELGMGFAKGELSGAAYRPAQPARSWQYKIKRTEYAGRSVTVPNAYRTDLALVSAPVHKITLDVATPVLPRARSADYIGDCFNVLFHPDHAKPLGRQIQYGEVLFGLKWIPWPRHADKPQPWPEEWA